MYYFKYSEVNQSGTSLKHGAEMQCHTTLYPHKFSVSVLYWLSCVVIGGHTATIATGV